MYRATITTLKNRFPEQVVTSRSKAGGTLLTELSTHPRVTRDNQHSEITHVTVKKMPCKVHDEWAI